MTVNPLVITDRFEILNEIFGLLLNEERNDVNIYKHILHTIYCVAFEIDSIHIPMIEYKK